MIKKTTEDRLRQPHRVTVVFELPHGNYQKLIDDIKKRYKTYAYYFVEPKLVLKFERAPAEDDDGETDF